MGGGIFGEGTSGALDGEEGSFLDLLWFPCSFLDGEAWTNWYLDFPEPSPLLRPARFSFLEIDSSTHLLPLSFFLKRRTEVKASPSSLLPGFVADLVEGPFVAPYLAVAPFDTPVSVGASAIAHSAKSCLLFVIRYRLLSLFSYILLLLLGCKFLSLFNNFRPIAWTFCRFLACPGFCNFHNHIQNQALASAGFWM